MKQIPRLLLSEISFQDFTHFQIRIIFFVWLLLTVLMLPSVCLARGATLVPEFAVEPPIPPIIDVEAWADSIEVTLPTNQTMLQVIAQQPSQSVQALTYHWLQTSGPPSGQVIFVPNNSENAYITTATFDNNVAGLYTFRVIVSDGVNEAVSEVGVTLNPPLFNYDSNESNSHDSYRANETKSRVKNRGNLTALSRTDRVIIRFDSNLPSLKKENSHISAEWRFRQLSAKTRATMASLGARITKAWCEGRIGLVTFESKVDVSAMLDRLREMPEVRYAVPDHYVNLAEFIPNDPQFVDQWGLENTADVDIDATSAWDQTTGNENVIVAVMDTGIDYTHPDLYLAIAINNGEIPFSLVGQIVDTNLNGQIDFYDLNSLDADGNVVLDSAGALLNEAFTTDQNGNGYIDAGDLMTPTWSDGVDDDSNGYVDDLTGWNYLDDNNNPIDNHGHGTHIAGIIAARGNNQVGIAGINWRAQLLPERFQDGGGHISELIQAIDHAVLQNANIINASWGTFVDNSALKDAILWAGEQGTVFVAAAGNQSNDIGNPSLAYYPAAYNDVPNLISVASVGSDGNLSGFSNFGLNTVDIAAPGSRVLSTGLNGSYLYWSGTSMAAPHVAGVASLLAGLFPNQPPEWIVDQLLLTSKPLTDLYDKTISGGMVNAFAAINTPSIFGPRIIAVSPVGEIVASTDRVVLTFDHPINVNTFTSTDISIVGPMGPIAPTNVSRLTDFVFEVTFPAQTDLGVYNIEVGPDIENSLGHAMDQDRDGIIGEFIDDRFHATFRQISPPQVWLIDDGEAGFTASSGWSSYAGSGLQGDFLYKKAGSGAATASWTFSGLPPGQYLVSATWQAYTNRVLDASYTILDGATVLATEVVNQRQAPADFFELEWWQDLGGPHVLTGDTLVVELSDLATPSGSYLVADAIRVERIADLPAGPELQVTVDGANVADGAGVVDFGSTLVGVPVSRTVVARNVGTTDLTLGAITVPEGFSVVSDFAATVVAPGQEASAVVQLEAAVAAEFSGVLSFASNDADENPFDVSLTGSVSDGDVSQVWLIDDGEAGFTASSGWSSYAGSGLQGDFLYKKAGSGAATASWTFSGLPPGQYLVSATWQAYTNRVLDASYTILDGATVLATEVVNQRQAPADFFELEWWQDLGGPHVLTGDTLVVELSDLATPSGSYLVADAIRVERIADLPAGPELQVTVDGANVADGAGVVDFGSTLVGVPVSRTVVARNVGTTDLTLGAITVPEGFSVVSDFAATVVAPGQEASAVVQLEAAVAAEFSGVLSFASNDADENPFDVSLTGSVSDGDVSQVWLIDDGEAGFTASSGWSSYAGSGLQGDFLYKKAGSGAATASWTFSGLPPGQYLVSATWQAYTNRVLDASYTILDGATVLATEVVNQRQAPADFFELEWWQDLGGPHVLTGDTLVVELSDLATPSGSYLVADAIRVERIADLPAGPELQVTVDGANVADGAGVVDFGSTLVGVPVSRTVVARNVGTTDLTLGAITVPEGFSVVSDFAATVVAPGQEASAVVQLEAAVAAEFSGVLSFASNDADENPFDVSLTGSVSDGDVSQVWLIDDGEAGFTASSGWSSYAGSGLQGDFLYKKAGSGAATASWTFSGLPPGQYLVSATWQAYTNRVLDASYTILDGATVLATEVVNQRQAPADFFELEWWQDLGGPHVLTGDTLVVELSDLATPSGSYLVADAIRVERIADLP